MNKAFLKYAATGVGAVGITGAAFVAGCGSHRSVPAPAPVTTAAVPPVAAPATTFQPYTLINQPPPIPVATTHLHRKLRIVTYRRQVFLADNDDHYYSAGRDNQGHLYPVYHDPVTNRAYPLYYDQNHDDYYRMIRTGDGDYYRNYVGTEGNDYYRDDNPPYVGSYNSGYSYGNGNPGYNSYNPYSPPPACLPQVYQPDGVLYNPQTAYYQDQPSVHRSHGDQDLWLLAIPLVIGAYLLLNQHHHSSGGGSGYYNGPGYSAPSGYYSNHPGNPSPHPGSGGPPFNPPGGYNSTSNSYTRNVSTTIINNNQRTTNIYTVSPPPEALARQPYQAPFGRPFAERPMSPTSASGRLAPPAPPSSPMASPSEQARFRPVAAPPFVSPSHFQAAPRPTATAYRHAPQHVLPTLPPVAARSPQEPKTGVPFNEERRGAPVFQRKAMPQPARLDNARPSEPPHRVPEFSETHRPQPQIAVPRAQREELNNSRAQPQPAFTEPKPFPAPPRVNQERLEGRVPPPQPQRHDTSLMRAEPPTQPRRDDRPAALAGGPRRDQGQHRNAARPNSHPDSAKAGDSRRPEPIQAATYRPGGKPRSDSGHDQRKNPQFHPGDQPR